MKTLTVEYATEFVKYAMDEWCQPVKPSVGVPVVRLAEVDAVIQEAVWAMELVFEQAPMFSEYTAKEMTDRSQAFLASPLVAAWRERQEGTS